jgi:kynureninase
MTQDEIIEMAKEAGARRSSNPDEYDVMKITDRCLEAFAKLVAAKEREACAKACEDRILFKALATAEETYEMLKKSIAADIRARGEA